MHTGRIAAATFTAALALSVGAPAAMASVDPDPIMPGQAITISDDRNCDRANGAKASSALFGDVIMSAGANHMFATVKVPSGTRSGSYIVTVECGVGGKTYNFTVHVSGVSAPAGAPSLSAVPSTPNGPTVPAKGPKTGLGGSVDATDTAEVVGGVGLLVVAGGVAALIKNRRAGGKR